MAAVRPIELCHWLCVTVRLVRTNDNVNKGNMRPLLQLRWLVVGTMACLDIISMPCLSRVRTDNRTLSSMDHNFKQSQGPHYVHPWQKSNSIRSPGLRSSCQSHRMSNNPCRHSYKLSSRRIQCYHLPNAVHSRAVDKLIRNHSLISNAKRIFGSQWICWKSHPGLHDAWPIKFLETLPLLVYLNKSFICDTWPYDS